ncbi:lipase [Leptospira ognonensis]|uniref:Lipase n=1 Tax=Leptospira ognonensis TaxID=2484945 RepID=A0A4R9JXN7_9LEPT|nr:lipase [Leptospira ognonensis]
MKSFLQKFGTFAIFSIATILGTELLLIGFNPASLQYYRDVKLLHAYHPDYGVTLQPNESRYIKHYAGAWEGRFTTNSLGLRGKEEPESQRPKLFCLGDSMVMGFGVSDEETFCSLLNRIKINEEVYQSLNLGVDAYGSLGDAKRLEDISQKVTNIKEVLFFISPNDFAMPEVLRNQGILPDDELDAMHENDERWKSNFRLQFEATRISFFLQALKLAYEQTLVIWAQNKNAFSLEWQAAIRNPSDYIYDSFFQEAKRNKCTSKKLEIEHSCPEPIPVEQFTCIDHPPDSKTLPELTPTTIRAYERMITLSKKYNFRLRPIVIPVQVEEIYCYLNGKYHPLGNYAIRAKKFWNSRGIGLIDLTPYTNKMCGSPISVDGKVSFSSIRDYFIPGDGHLTKEGNKWVAESLKSVLGATR